MARSNRTPKIPIYTPSFGRRERELTARVVREGWITSDGPYVTAFERQFSRYVGAPYGVAVTNGTAALHVGLAALGIGPGDEVIIPDATMVSCMDVVLYTGATPVFVDVDPGTWTIDPDLVERAITPKTRAIMPVHTYGHPAEMDRLLRIGRAHDVAIIEDAAEAHGSTYRGKRVGALGDLGCFSFYASKIVSTGEGGMVVTRNRKLAERTERLHELAYESVVRNYRHTEVGFNYRLTDLQAAVGLAQLERLPKFLRRRRECVAVYAEVLGGIEGLTVQSEASWARSAYWAYTVLVHGGEARRKRVMAALQEKGIASRVAFWPMHRQKFAPGAGDGTGNFPVADRIGIEGMSLPFGNGISLDSVREVAERLRSALGKLPPTRSVLRSKAAEP